MSSPGTRRRARHAAAAATAVALTASRLRDAFRRTRARRQTRCCAGRAPCDSSRCSAATAATACRWALVNEWQPPTGDEPRWAAPFFAMLAGVPDRPWGTERFPIFIVSSNFGIDSMYAHHRHPRGEGQLPFILPQRLTAWFRGAAGVGTERDAIISHACVSANLALLYASRQVTAGLAEEALVVSYDFLSPFVTGGFHAMKILAARRMPAPYADRAFGAIGLGDGAAFAVVAPAGAGNGELRGWKRRRASTRCIISPATTPRASAWRNSAPDACGGGGPAGVDQGPRHGHHRGGPAGGAAHGGMFPGRAAGRVERRARAHAGQLRAGRTRGGRREHPAGTCAGHRGDDAGRVTPRRSPRRRSTSRASPGSCSTPSRSAARTTLVCCAMIRRYVCALPPKGRSRARFRSNWCARGRRIFPPTPPGG